MCKSLVSVVVPTYNRAHCVTRAIDSALSQTHANVEVVVIDDGSADNTPQLIEQRYGGEKRVKYFRQPNQGVTAARNQGLAQTTGDYIALLDSDDWWKPWKIEAQLSAFSRFPEIGMVWTDMEAVDPSGKVVHNTYIRRMYSCWHYFTMEQLFTGRHSMADVMPSGPTGVKKGVLYTGDIFSQMFMGSLVHTSTVLLSRARLEKVRGFNEALKTSGEDYDFHLRTCREGPVAFIDIPSIEYQVGAPDQLTNPKYKVIAVGNCLKTIVAAYDQDRERIHLPRSMVRRRFAEVHAWLGEVLLDAGHPASSRSHLARGLRYQPWTPRAIKLLPLSLLPPSLGDAARSAYRRLRRSAAISHR